MYVTLYKKNLYGRYFKLFTYVSALVVMVLVIYLVKVVSDGERGKLSRGEGRW